MPRGNRARWSCAHACVWCALILSGCAHDQPVNPEEPPSEFIPELDAQEAITAWNSRVERLERLWARVTVVVNTVDAAGEAVTEQAEGHLQIERPRGVALSLGKLGETYLYLGSNDERYWWIDVVDRENRAAVTGRHAAVTMEKAARLGVPVHPLELVEVLGLTPIGDGAVVDGTTVTTPTATGGRVVRFVDPETFEPVRIDVVDAAGELVLSASHEAYQLASVRDDTRVKPRVPGRVIVEAPTVPATVRLALYDPENRDIREIAFDFDRLLKAFRVETVYDLDATAAVGDMGESGARP
jgi:hypothetical protein